MTTIVKSGGQTRLFLGACGIALAAMAAPSSARDMSPARPSPLTQPAHPAAYYKTLLRARELLAKEDFAGAEPLYEQLVRDYPLDRSNWNGLGTIKRRLGKCAEAIPAYRKSIELIGPTPGQSRYFIAACQAKLGDKEAALETLRALVFNDAYLNRPNLISDPEFASLKDEPRFQALAGRGALPKMSREEGWRSDLDYLLAEIRRVTPEYRYKPLPQAMTAAAAILRRDIPNLSDEQVYARMAELVGMLNINHTLFGNPGFLSAPDTIVKDSFLPLRFHAFPEGIFIVDANEGFKDLVGARLIAIDGTPAEAAMTKVAGALSAGSDAEIYWTAPRRMSEATLLAGLGVAKKSADVTLRLKMPNGAETDRNIAGQAETSLSAKLLPPPGVNAPLFLTRVPEAHWFEFWPDRGAAYVQVNQILPDKDESLPDFGLRLRRELEGNPDIRTVILDLRHNNGGNTFTYPELLRTLIAFSTKPGNRIYALIGRNVYSATANFATELERLANPIFVGEPTSNFGNQEGDEAGFRLPYSGVRGLLGGVWWQLSNPWDKRRSIVPQIPVQLTAKDYFAGRDPVLETAQRLIAEQSK